MGLTRRDFFTLGLGAAAAVPLTPMPWKLLEDSAKWSQNWSWIPRPPSGPRSIRKTVCTLCPAGCGMEVRCVGRNLVGISPAANHPVSRGVLCPYAFSAHQLSFHPARVITPPANLNPIVERVRSGVVAILDERPGRAVSAAYQKMMADRGGLYITAPRPEETTLHRIAAGSSVDVSELGLAFENVQTLVSFGAPVLESWATPGRVLTLWREKRLRIVQVEREMSKTAALASQWIRQDWAQPDIDGPFLAISGGNLTDEQEQAVADLNRRSAAVVRKRGIPRIPSTPLAQVPNESVDVLFIDHGPLGGSIPLNVLRPKIRPQGIVVSLSPYRAGAAAQADYLIPVPAFMETIDEAPTPWDATTPSYAVAPALREPPPGVVHPLVFVARMLGSEVSPEGVIRSRVEEIVPAKNFKSRDEIWTAMLNGWCWTDPAAPTIPVNWHPASVPQSIYARRSAVVPPLVTGVKS